VGLVRGWVECWGLASTSNYRMNDIWTQRNSTWGKSAVGKDPGPDRFANAYATIFQNKIFYLFHLWINDNRGCQYSKTSLVICVTHRIHCCLIEYLYLLSHLTLLRPSQFYEKYTCITLNQITIYCSYTRTLKFWLTFRMSQTLVMWHLSVS
jgi:hypothetical protein